MYSYNSGVGDVWFVFHVLIVVLLHLMLNFRRGMLCVGSGRNFRPMAWTWLLWSSFFYMLILRELLLGLCETLVTELNRFLEVGGSLNGLFPFFIDKYSGLFWGIQIRKTCYSLGFMFILGMKFLRFLFKSVRVGQACVTEYKLLWLRIPLHLQLDFLILVSHVYFSFLCFCEQWTKAISADCGHHKSSIFMRNLQMFTAKFYGEQFVWCAAEPFCCHNMILFMPFWRNVSLYNIDRFFLSKIFFYIAELRSYVLRLPMLSCNIFGLTFSELSGKPLSCSSIRKLTPTHWGSNLY